MDEETPCTTSNKKTFLPHTYMCNIYVREPRNATTLHIHVNK